MITISTHLAEHPQVQVHCPLRVDARHRYQRLHLDQDLGQGVHQGDHQIQG